jgi:hypothetical protein
MPGKPIMTIAAHSAKCLADAQFFTFAAVAGHIWRVGIGRQGWAFGIDGCVAETKIPPASYSLQEE